MTSSGIWRSAARLTAALLAAALVAACGGGSQQSTGTTTKRLTIGVSYPTSNNVFWDRYIAFMKNGASQLGVDLVAVSADNNEQKQVSDVESLISRKVDGLVITPQSTAVAKGLLRTATNAKVPVVVTDRYPGYEPSADSTADYTAFVGPNDQQAGQGIMDALAADGVTKVIGLGGVPGSSVAEGRKAGLTKSLSEHSTVKLVDYQGPGETQELGQKTMENELSAHPAGTFDGVWCYNDALCLGALQALKNANRLAGVKLGGMDLNPDAVSAIKKSEYDVSFGGHWLQGGFGLVILYDKIHGKTPKQGLVKLNLLKIDKNNVDKFLDQYVNNPPKYDFKQLSQVYNANASATFEITLK